MNKAPKELVLLLVLIVLILIVSAIGANAQNALQLSYQGQKVEQMHLRGELWSLAGSQAEQECIADLSLYVEDGYVVLNQFYPDGYTLLYRDAIKNAAIEENNIIHLFMLNGGELFFFMNSNSFAFSTNGMQGMRVFSQVRLVDMK